jgi:hypothetical protein
MHKGVGRGVGHGTLVLDIAAGHDPRLPNGRRLLQPADHRRAQLPGSRARCAMFAAARTSTPYAYHGAYYVLLRAAIPLGKLGHAPPVVINLSYDILQRPHDGTSVF